MNLCESLISNSDAFGGESHGEWNVLNVSELSLRIPQKCTVQSGIKFTISGCIMGILIHCLLIEDDVIAELTNIGEKRAPKRDNKQQKKPKITATMMRKLIENDKEF